MTDAVHTPVLKPCPFCGGEASLCVKSSHRHAPFIYCLGCLASSHDFETRDEAITAWNARTADIEAGVIAELVEAGKDALDALLSARAAILNKMGTKNPAREAAIERLTNALAKIGDAS